MDAESKRIFLILFKEATEKCFGSNLQQPLTETESKLLYNQIFETTGLIIGWKSLKNYSLFVMNENSAREENPSIATLDTLARYVLKAPYTTETERKSRENHFPYWFKYKEQQSSGKRNIHATSTVKKFLPLILITLACIVVAVFAFYFFGANTSKNFTTDFHVLDEDSLTKSGWFLKDRNDTFWNKRSENPGALSLFTLSGDNWPDAVHRPAIKNLLLRKIDADCFITEVHLQNFFPQYEWQQAGILLMEDTSYNAKTLRLSLAYNDFFGGFARPKEVIIQAINSPGNGLSQPEEIAHLPVFTLDSNNETLIKNNLAYSALRIEKTGNNFRLLYSCGPSKNFAFKDAVSRDLNFKPKYIGLFALQGFVQNDNYMPAEITYFTFSAQACK